MIAPLTVAQEGLSALPYAREVAHHVLHISMGVFFAASGWNKLTNASRHASIRRTMEEDHVPLPHFNEWWVPGWELGAGLALIAGFIPAFAAAVLLIICLVACKAEATRRVAAYKPINRADTIADYLYLPEVLYSIMLALIVLGV